MFGAIVKATNSSFQKSVTFCRSIHVKKVMKLLAFIFERPRTYLNWNSNVETMKTSRFLVFHARIISSSWIKIHVRYQSCYM